MSPGPVKLQSASAYVHSGQWLRPLTAAAALYMVLFLLLLVLVRRPPTRGALSEKAQLPADTLLLLKLVGFTSDHMSWNCGILICEKEC